MRQAWLCFLFVSCNEWEERDMQYDALLMPLHYSIGTIGQMQHQLLLEVLHEWSHGRAHQLVDDSHTGKEGRTKDEHETFQ